MGTSAAKQTIRNSRKGTRRATNRRLGALVLALICGFQVLLDVSAAGAKETFPESSAPIEVQQKFETRTEEGVSLYCAAKTDPSGAVSLAVLMDSPTSKAINTAGWSKPGSIEKISSPPCDAFLGVDFQITCVVDNGGLYQNTSRCIRDSKSILGVSAADYSTTAHLGLDKDLRSAFVSWWGGVYGQEKGVYEPPTYLHPASVK